MAGLLYLREGRGQWPLVRRKVKREGHRVGVGAQIETQTCQRGQFQGQRHTSSSLGKQGSQQTLHQSLGTGLPTGWAQWSGGVPQVRVQPEVVRCPPKPTTALSARQGVEGGCAETHL